MRYDVVTALCCGLAVGLSAQTPAPQSPDQSRFDVVSIKPSGPNKSPECQPPTCYRSFFMPRPNHFQAFRMSVLGLVGFAYSMPANRLFGPDWAKLDEFDIEAAHGQNDSNLERMRPMVQHLLEERFALKMHHEQRQMPVWLLAKARDDGKLGPQLVAITGCTEPPAFMPPVFAGSCGVTGVPSATVRGGLGMWKNLNLYAHLAQALDRPVIDETGLSGWFAYLLEWSDPLRESTQATSTAVNRPELFTALREQLGLKLEKAERPLDTIVVDSVERPAAN
jgi:uncharacterized protein (TIGR03435 family)